MFYLFTGNFLFSLNKKKQRFVVFISLKILLRCNDDIYTLRTLCSERRMCTKGIDSFANGRIPNEYFPLSLYTSSAFNAMTSQSFQSVVFFGKNESIFCFPVLRAFESFYAKALAKLLAWKHWVDWIVFEHFLRFLLNILEFNGRYWHEFRDNWRCRCIHTRVNITMILYRTIYSFIFGYFNYKQLFTIHRFNCDVLECWMEIFCGGW